MASGSEATMIDHGSYGGQAAGPRRKTQGRASVRMLVSRPRVMASSLGRESSSAGTSDLSGGGGVVPDHRRRFVRETAIRGSPSSWRVPIPLTADLDL
jgi:hypothetical protein